MLRFRAPRRAVLAAILSSVLLSACGGGDYWDEFVPRDPTIDDIESQSFVFTDFSYGAVFDPALDHTRTTLAFGPASADGSAHRLPFSLLADGAAAAGRARLQGPRLTLDIESAGSGLPFTVGQRLDFDLQADIDDGRIRLTNRSSGVQQTSAPR
ncbi:MAG: hypothetical protein KIT35_09760 [Piscinibacter sp.]|uniref:hypothetical protein n=1 Tax=Piscinibacter TaxID=1114981 RepID=UPI000FDE83E0|nr:MULTISPECIES: hypothetical protein [Piscinibacter]MCW5664107.1 hypothetical protein [Piscinibacter sp.]